MTVTPLTRQAVGTGLFTGCGLLVLVVTAISAAQTTQRTYTAQQTVSAALGWAAAAPRLEAAWVRWDPHHDATRATTPAWWATERLQQAVTHSGVRVVRLEPSGAQATAPVLKAAVAGSSQAVAAFLEGVPQWLPGVTLHRLELVTQEQGVECRLDLTVPPPPTGGTPA